MREELRQKIIDFNVAAKANKEAAADLYKLLGALPPGQIKALKNNPVCAEILEKYGIS